MSKTSKLSATNKTPPSPNEGTVNFDVRTLMTVGGQRVYSDQGRRRIQNAPPPKKK